MTTEKSQDEDMLIRVGGLVSGILLILIGFVLTGFGLTERVLISILGAIIGIGAIWITSRKKTNKNKRKSDFEIELDDIQSDVKEILMERHFRYGQKNLEKHGAKGIVLRIDDKIERLHQMLNDSKLRKDANESVEDACFDGIGYFVQCIRLIRDGKIEPDPSMRGKKKCPFCMEVNYAQEATIIKLTEYEKMTIKADELREPYHNACEALFQTIGGMDTTDIMKLTPKDIKGAMKKVIDYANNIVIGDDEEPYFPPDAIVVFCPNCVEKTTISMGMIASDVPIVCHACGLSFKSDKEGGWIKLDKWVYDDEHFSHLEPIVPSAHDDLTDAEEIFWKFSALCIDHGDRPPRGENGSCGHSDNTSKDMICNMETCPQHWRGTD